MIRLFNLFLISVLFISCSFDKPSNVTEELKIAGVYQNFNDSSENRAVA